MMHKKTEKETEDSIHFENLLKKIFICSGCILLIFCGVIIGKLLSANHSKSELIKLYETNKKLSDTLIDLYEKAHKIDSIKISDTCPVKWEIDKNGKPNLKYN